MGVQGNRLSPKAGAPFVGDDALLPLQPSALSHLLLGTSGPPYPNFAGDYVAARVLPSRRFLQL
jgi:hypothetical protein